MTNITFEEVKLNKKYVGKYNEKLSPDFNQQVCTVEREISSHNFWVVRNMSGELIDYERHRVDLFEKIATCNRCEKEIVIIPNEVCQNCTDQIDGPRMES